jgi:hypothetical protein
VHPAGCVDVGVLAAPAACALGQVGHPQGVAPAVRGLEQAQLGTGVGRSRRAKTRIDAGQPPSWSPARPMRSRAVSSVTTPTENVRLGQARAAGRTPPGLPKWPCRPDYRVHGHRPHRWRHHQDRAVPAGHHLIRRPASALRPGSPRQAVAALPRATSESMDVGGRGYPRIGVDVRITIETRVGHIHPIRHAAHPATHYRVSKYGPDFASASSVPVGRRYVQSYA